MPIRVLLFCLLCSSLTRCSFLLPEFWDDLGCIGFSGRYPDNLIEEIGNYEAVASVLAHSLDFDIIHSHDWLTYPAGVFAKQISGKPLVIHVHATDFDRSRGNVNPTVYAIEKRGMDEADHIMCVSNLTRRTVIEKYGLTTPLIIMREQARLPVTVQLMRMSGEYIKLWGPLMSGYAIASIPVIVLFTFSMRLFVKGLTEGAVKG